MLTSIDYQLFIFLNTFFSNSFFDLVIPHITKERNLLYVYFFASAVHIAVVKDKILALKRVGIATLLLIISDAAGHRIIKEIFDRPRPSHSIWFVDGVHILFPQCNFLLGQRSSLSFPSNHAITNAALATIWTFWYPKAGKVLIPFALFIAYTRIYCGVHFPLDIFFGIIFGAGFAYLTYISTKRFCVKTP
ncbi:MAG: phosphatase PAP2 family protein [Chitinivibrionia bacterium]|nr:phosphatase PAP2 family protein [Chitinivibrionia bacterium]